MKKKHTKTVGTIFVHNENEGSYNCVLVPTKYLYVILVMAKTIYTPVVSLLLYIYHVYFIYGWIILGFHVHWRSHVMTKYLAIQIYSVFSMYFIPFLFYCIFLPFSCIFTHFLWLFTFYPSKQFLYCLSSHIATSYFDVIHGVRPVRKIKA